MSLAINTNNVRAVLLADGWHEVDRINDGEEMVSSFDLDAYEFVERHGTGGLDFETLHGGGQSGVCATGFTFLDADTGDMISGPLTAMLAVRHALPVKTAV